MLVLAGVACAVDPIEVGEIAQSDEPASTEVATPGSTPGETPTAQTAAAGSEAEPTSAADPSPDVEPTRAAKPTPAAEPTSAGEQASADEESAAGSTSELSTPEPSTSEPTTPEASTPDESTPEESTPAESSADESGTDLRAELESRRRAPCQVVEADSAPDGEVIFDVEVLADGLEVPWGVDFLPSGDVLVTERPGRLRLIENDRLVDEPILEVEIAQIQISFGSEGGLLGVLAHPDFESNRLIYLYITATKESGEIVNRMLRYQMTEDLRSATLEQVILDDIPTGGHHQGGRMAFGPDGKLWVAVGAFDPREGQNPGTLAGKMLRLELDGSIPADNPDPASPIVISGIRNSQGFDWIDDETLVMIDHGPSASVDSGRLHGLDELNVVKVGGNLGWAVVWGCHRVPGVTEPVVVWREAIAPAGAVLYRGDAFPEWNGSVLVGTLGLGGRGLHLERIGLDPDNATVVEEREQFLYGEYGRLRTVAVGPDGAVYVTTSNCDGRGTCPPDGDLVLRLTPQ